MTTLNKYFNSTNSYNPTPETNTIIISAKIPPLFEDKVKRIIKVKGYTSYQDYFNSLFNSKKELEEIIIPYEILKMIEEDYNSITIHGC